MSFAEKRFVIVQVCQGVLFMRLCQPPVLHLDLKPANVLVSLSIFFCMRHCSMCSLVVGWKQISACPGCWFWTSKDYEWGPGCGLDNHASRDSDLPGTQTTNWGEPYRQMWHIRLGWRYNRAIRRKASVAFTVGSSGHVQSWSRRVVPFSGTSACCCQDNCRNVLHYCEGPCQCWPSLMSVLEIKTLLAIILLSILLLPMLRSHVSLISSIVIIFSFKFISQQ